MSIYCLVTISSFLILKYRNRHDSSLEQKEISLLSAWAGCRVVRECAKRAFEKHGRAVLTSHLVEEIGPAYASLFENGN